MCEQAWTNIKMPAKIFRKSVLAYTKYHPTQKPVELMAWCIFVAKVADTILDPFMGSGTTLVAAKQLGRKAIGIEISEDYCRIAVERLRQECFDFSTSKDLEAGQFPGKSSLPSGDTKGTEQLSLIGNGHQTAFQNT